MPRSYFWTMLFLILHQIDAAYWKEWEMFHVPGGVQGFLVFNLARPLPWCWSATGTCCWPPRGRPCMRAVCAALGVGTFLIHAGFALAGQEQFHLPLSVAIIALCLAAASGCCATCAARESRCVPRYKRAGA